jgi:hypothetical protein
MAPAQACGHLVRGLDFHKYYFDHGEKITAGGAQCNVTVLSSDVRVLGDVAIIAYNRVVQRGASSTCFEETRVWKREASDWGKWRLLHFHRSKTSH